MKTYQEINKMYNGQHKTLNGATGSVEIKRTEKGATVTIENKVRRIPQKDFEIFFGNLNSIGLIGQKNRPLKDMRAKPVF